MGRWAAATNQTVSSTRCSPTPHQTTPNTTNTDFFGYLPLLVPWASACITSMNLPSPNSRGINTIHHLDHHLSHNKLPQVLPSLHPPLPPLAPSPLLFPSLFLPLLILSKLLNIKGGGSTFSVLDTLHLALILGGASGGTATFQSISVWQNSTYNNLVN
jgi:hypothetical protein